MKLARYVLPISSAPWQMPWDIPEDTVATVAVANGSSTSNAAAVFVPAAGTPGISVYGNNRAVVVNKHGVTVNVPTAPAAAGDEVAAYFTGGGPFQAAGKVTTGDGSPAGLSPVTGNNSVTVGNMPAAVKYMGLIPKRRRFIPCELYRSAARVGHIA